MGCRRQAGRGSVAAGHAARAALAVAVLATSLAAGTAPSGAAPDAAWKNGPPADAAYFPVAVWLQEPRLAPQYKAAGVNLYVGLWKGPTEEQLAALRAAGMPVICQPNAVGLKHRDDRTIIGWMHGDEPDNAQPLGPGKGYGPPVPPDRIIADYARIRAADPTRPVLLNLGQGVAWDGWHGRGTRTNHPEDYPKYVKGGDIVSFDIYPVNHPKPEVAGHLEYVARGVERLVGWTGGRKRVWNCIECTRIRGPRRPTPHEVRAEVWMAIIHGSQGLIYFVHQWQPKFSASALLDDNEMLQAVTAVNGQIAALAPVLNAPDVPGGVRAASANPAVPVAAVMKRYGGAAYVFAVAMRDGRTTATFEVRQVGPAGRADVLGEGRRLSAPHGRFVDEFGPWTVHLYRVTEGPTGPAR
jgi:hypothetical protein